jgi:hypothetical protein
MLKTLSIAHYKSFGAKQTIDFASPGNGKAGLTVLVGPNNTGKSTTLSVLRRLFDQRQFLKASREDRRGDEIIDISLQLESAAAGTLPINIPLTVSLEGKQNEAYYPKKITSASTVQPVQQVLSQNHNPATFLTLKSISCRRPWGDAFTASSTAPPSYASDAENQFRHEEPGAQSNALASALFALDKQGKKAEFDKLLKSILPEIHEWTIDCPVDADFVCYKTPSGSLHRLSLAGEGIINVFRIAFTLLHLARGDVLLIDEPELSLYPQAQRRLASTILDLSKKNQIIIATHSPHFVSWQALADGARIWRQTLNNGGDTMCGTISNTTFNAIKGVVQSDIKNRRLYDVVAKEIFFADSLLFTEGPDDVHYIENYLQPHEPMQLFGYGSGGSGNLQHWLRVADELGIRSAALYDGNKAAEYETAVHTFVTRPNVAIFKLFKDDIRDWPAEGSEPAKEGVFNKKGVIHPHCKAKFDLLLGSMRVHLIASEG